MRLQLIVAILLFASPATAQEEPSEPETTQATPPAAPPPHSDIDAKASLQVGGYLDSTATSVLTPSVAGSIENPTAGWGVNGSYLVDMVSAASPDIISTASPNFHEVRHAGSLGGKYKPGDYGGSVYGSISYTPDYLSIVGGGQLVQDLDDKNLTLVEGYGYGRDTIGRTGTPFSVFSRTLDYHSIQVGASRVVNPALVLGLYGDAVLERGDQSKPYRYIPVFAPAVAFAIPVGASATSIANARLEAKPLEQLPLSRNRFALTGRLAWRLTTTTLKIDERVYADDWGQRASTTDARFFIDLGPRWTVWPHLRFNVQSSVSFWERAYYANSAHDLPSLRTGDRELSALFTIGGGGGLRVGLGPSGRIDSFVLTATLDGYYTSFADTIYVKERFAGLTTVGVEKTF